MKSLSMLAVFAGATFFAVALSPTAAHAQPLGQGGVRAGVIKDVEADRVTGVAVAAYGDIRGIGMVMGLDYQNVSMPIDDGEIFGHSLGFSVGFRFSPVSFVDADRALRYFDAYGAAVLDGGGVYRRGRTDRGSRSSSYVALGLELRPDHLRVPGVVFEYQWREQGDEYQVGNTVFVGIALVGSGRKPVRD